MNGRILITEDEALVALEIEMVVNDAGYSVAGMASNQSKAIKIIDAGECDAAIIDANLSGTSAEPIADRLRTAGIPFVVVSGYSADQINWLQDAPLIGKPFSTTHLTSALHRLLDGA